MPGMSLAALIAPLPVDRFLAEFWCRRPVHIRAPREGGRPGLVDWARLNLLLAQRAHWDADHLKLVMNSRGVPGEHFLQPVPGFGNRLLADPARVEALLALGASMVANEVQDADPTVRALTDALGRQFGARAWGNLYASFRGVQAFASHCDTHEVFALQCEGEKRWRLYANPAVNPTETPHGDDAQARIDAAKGPVILDIVLKPGDVLYIPRGWYHDAIASAESSLHLTIGVLPHTARVLFDLLAREAMQDPLFRAYLPDARIDGGGALAAHVAALLHRLGEIAATPAFRDDIAVEQARSVDPVGGLRLPQRPVPRFYARTGRAFVIRQDGGVRVLAAGGTTVPLGRAAEVAQWVLDRPACSVGEVAAHFAHHDGDAIRALMEQLAALGLIERYTPAM